MRVLLKLLKRASLTVRSFLLEWLIADVPEACHHEPLEVVYNVPGRPPEALRGIGGGWYSVEGSSCSYTIEGAKVEVYIHICKHCGEVYGEVLEVPE